MLRKVSYLALTTCLLLLVTTAATPSPQEQAAAEKTSEKQWKDRQEYDIASKVFSEADPKTRLDLLAQWEKAYPETDYAQERFLFHYDSYQKLNNTEKVIEYSKKVVNDPPFEFNDATKFNAHYQIVSLTIPAAGADQAKWAEGEKSTKALLGGVIEKHFAAANKPANVPQEQWDKAKKDVTLLCHTTLGWVAMQRKNNVEAEKIFKQVLGLNPNNGQVSYWLGNVVLAQGDPNKNELALFCYARASIYEGEGALNDQGRQQVDEYLKKVYSRYAGSEAGLDDLKGMAKSSALPPANLKIKSGEERKFEEEQKARADNPLRYKFMDLREVLKGPKGADTWSNLNGKIAGPYKLFVVSSSPAERPTTINLSSQKGGSVEVVLELANRSRDAIGSGREVSFEGVAVGLNKDPFRLSLNDGVLK